MTWKRSSLAKLGLILAVLVIPGVSGGVRQVAPNSGNELFWQSSTIPYYLNENGTTDVPGLLEFPAIDDAFATWTAIPDSDLVFQTMGTTSAGLDLMDGMNTILFQGAGGSIFEELPTVRAITRIRGIGPGRIIEAEIALNDVNFTWTNSATDAFSGASGPVDIQAVITHEAGHLAGLDHVTARNAALFPFIYPGDTSPRTLTQDEISAAQWLFPAAGAPTDTTISGTVLQGGVGIARAIVVAFQNGDPVATAMTDANGVYTIHRVPAGSYLVRVQPYSNSATVTLSTYFHNPVNVDVDFLSKIYVSASRENGAVAVVATSGTDTPGINFTVSTTGNTDDAFEQDDTFSTAKSISPGAGATILHAWPASDEDWVSFNAVAGRIYIIETRNLGLQRDDTISAQDSATQIELYDQTGTGLLASNLSPNPFEQVHGSRIVRNETATATRYVRVRQRIFSTIGAGVYTDLVVRQLTGPFNPPSITSVDANRSTEAGGIVVTIRGSNFIPGATATFGGTAASSEDVQGCDSTFTNCTAIKVQVPAHIPGTVDVVVTNPDGQLDTLPSAFIYDPERKGTYVDESFGTFILGEYTGHGTVLCWGDYDDDGDSDLYYPFVSDTTFTTGELFDSLGNGLFNNITASAGLDTVPPARTSCAWGDADGDGDLDLFVSTAAASGADNNLWRNNGDFTFTDIAVSPGIAGDINAAKTDGAWADYDLDGDLDLYLTYANSTRDNQLFDNDGAANFSDVAFGAQVALQANSQRALWADYDNDGFPDLFVINFSGASDTLYHNNGNGTFTDVTLAAGIVEASNCDDAAWADFNGDGFLDLFCAGIGTAAFPNLLWLSDGDGTFTESGVATGLALLNRNTSAITVLDKDNDGDEDIFLGNAFSLPVDMLLENDGQNSPLFSDVSVSSGAFDSFALDGLTAASADFDLDSHVDIVVTGRTGGFQDTYVWHNTSNTNDSLTIRLAGTLSNSWGIGAEIEVIPTVGMPPTKSVCDAATGIRKEVIGGSTNQNSMEVEFGVGSRPIGEQVVDCVKVFWPRSGLSQVFTRVAVNQILVVTETAPDENPLPTRVILGSGTTFGGQDVTILGFNFDMNPMVFFGLIPATNILFVDENTITCTTPVGAGPTDVTVDLLSGASGTLVDGYTYIAPGTDIALTLNKDHAQNEIEATWTDAGQERYQFHRAEGPTAADFTTGLTFETIVASTAFTDGGILNNGISYYFLVPGGTCGNSTLDPAENCESTDLNGETCMTLGFATGTLSCSAICTFDVSSCSF